VKRAGESEQGGRVSQERIGKCRSDEVLNGVLFQVFRVGDKFVLTSSVGRGIAAFMITVKSNVETEVLGQVVVITVPQELGVVTFE
jgi:hypothetical protein